MKLFYVILFSLSCVWAAQAQSTHVLTVNAPSPAAGSYLAQVASFGPYRSLVEGQLILVRDNQGQTLGCGGISNDLSGRIAVIDRGVCSFSEKVLRAQERGAIAAIVINNVSTAPELINMGVTLPFAAQINIPSFFMTLGQGSILKNALAQGVQVRIASRPFEDPDSLARTIVWGGISGQGDFAGGLNGWRVRNIYCSGGQRQPTVDLWRWAPDGATPVTSCGRGVIASPTQANGAAMFSSNLLDDRGLECGAGLGTGDCPTAQLGELISPVIPLRGAGTTGYQLKFYQFARQLNSNYFVLWSVNGGSSWDTLQINQDLRPNTVNTSPLVLLPLRGTGNADSLVVKFLHLGNYYHWIIDDVQVLAQEPYNLRVTDFYAIPPNYATPLSQVEPIGFLADVENIGSVGQDNVLLNVQIRNPGNQVAFNANLDYGALASNTLVENRAFSETFIPGAKGEYAGAYNLGGSQTDFDPRDNVRSFSFSITDSTFAKENGTALRSIAPAASNWQPNEPHSAAYGNVFYTPKGKGRFSRKVTFALANAADLKDRGLILSLYKWVDANRDGLCQAAERNLVAFNFYEVQGNESNPLRFIDLPLPAEGEPPVELEDGAAYLVMLEYYAPQVDGVDLHALVSDQFNYQAQLLWGLERNAPRFTTMTGIAGDLTQETFNPFGYSRFAGTYSYLVRWHISADPAGPTSAAALPSIADQIAVFPNPAKEFLHIQFGLQRQAQRMEVWLMDMAGKVVYRNTWAGVQRDTRMVPTDHLPAGMYILRLHSDQGVATKKVVVH